MFHNLVKIYTNLKELYNILKFKLGIIIIHVINYEYTWWKTVCRVIFYPFILLNLNKYNYILPTCSIIRLIFIVLYYVL